MPIDVGGDLTANALEVSDRFLREGSGQILFRGSGARVAFEAPYSIGHLVLTISSDATITVGRESVFFDLHLHALAPGAAIRIGAHVGFVGSVSISSHEEAGITVGDHCLFAHGTNIMASDVHHIFDLATDARINPPEDVVLGDTVWLGGNVKVMKGARIGRMSVVGAESVVAGTYPEHSLIAGVPARVIRSGIYWKR